MARRIGTAGDCARLAFMALAGLLASACGTLSSSYTARFPATPEGVIAAAQTAVDSGRSSVTLVFATQMIDGVEYGPDWVTGTRLSDDGSGMCLTDVEGCTPWERILTIHVNVIRPGYPMLSRGPDADRWWFSPGPADYEEALAYYEAQRAVPGQGAAWSVRVLKWRGRDAERMTTISAITEDQVCGQVSPRFGPADEYCFGYDEIAEFHVVDARRRGPAALADAASAPLRVVGAAAQVLLLGALTQQ
ncbi:MAG: hypothetical protein ACFE0P_08860 [Oceanicaulis sp.]